MEKDTDATGTAAGVTSAPRHVYGPRALAALLPRLTRPAFRRAGPAGAQVMADWEAIVGPALAAVTQPQRLSAGTLTIACSGPIALELQHFAPELIARINVQLGAAPVERLRFTRAGFRAASQAAARPAPDEAALRAAWTATELVPEGALRDALASLGAAVLARRDATPVSRFPSPRKRRHDD